MPDFRELLLPGLLTNLELICYLYPKCPLPSPVIVGFIGLFLFIGFAGSAGLSIFFGIFVSVDFFCSILPIPRFAITFCNAIDNSGGIGTPIPARAGAYFINPMTNSCTDITNFGSVIKSLLFLNPIA